MRFLLVDYVRSLGLSFRHRSIYLVQILVSEIKIYQYNINNARIIQM